MVLLLLFIKKSNDRLLHQIPVVMWSFCVLSTLDKYWSLCNFTRVLDITTGTEVYRWNLALAYNCYENNKKTTREQYHSLYICVTNSLFKFLHFWSRNVNFFETRRYRSLTTNLLFYFLYPQFALISVIFIYMYIFISIYVFSVNKY